MQIPDFYFYFFLFIFVFLNTAFIPRTDHALCGLEGGIQGGGGKIMQKRAANRRALTEINRNNIGAPSYVVKKTALSE